MKVLMLGWEFPPVFSGGLGVVCKNLSVALAQRGVEIHFALPYYIRKSIPESDIPDSFSLLEFHDIAEKILKNISLLQIPTLLFSPYLSQELYRSEKLEDWEDQLIHSFGDAAAEPVYGKNLFAEIERFAMQMEIFVRGRKFDIVHAHDWITFQAALRLKHTLQVPLLLHVHATEVDRTGNNPNPEIYNRERHAFAEAHKIVTVSDYTKETLVKHYDADPKKIVTVHNAHRLRPHPHHDLPDELLHKKKDEKIVLFIGRVTLQKGPDYFYEVAKKVVAADPSIKFVFVGEGDMLPHILHRTSADRLQNNIFFLGFLDGEAKRQVYQNADLCVIPSVSEPFGLIALEAVEYGVPVIVSAQSGVKEVLYHSLKADFWDVERMADYVMAVLRYPVLQKMMAQMAHRETKNLCWEEQARKIEDVYSQLRQEYPDARHHSPSHH